MVRITLKQFAEEAGKSISDIARETGLNRNTVTALYHGKVDGIKFPTIEAICQTYNLRLGDILQMDAPASSEVSGLYKQEAEMLPFMTWPWFEALTSFSLEGVRNHPGQAQYYCKEEYGAIFWEQASLNTYAEEIYRVYCDREKFDVLYGTADRYIKQIGLLYDALDVQAIRAMNRKSLRTYIDEVKEVYTQFYNHVAWIAAFDAGADDTIITRITRKFGFSHEDAGVLLTPPELPFYDERRMELLRIAKDFLLRVSADKREEFVQHFVHTHDSITKYMRTYNFYKSNYIRVNHISAEEVEQELLEILTDTDSAMEELDELQQKPKAIRKQQTRVLKKYGINDNPLWFFERITQWRRHERKRAALQGVHILDAILQAVEHHTGIPKAHLGYMNFDELPNVLSGLVTAGELRERYEGGLFITTEDGEHTIIRGPQAEALKEELEEQLTQAAMGSYLISGTMASPGYVKARARIVLGKADFADFQEGEVLVTSMTRPEFYPLMRKAAAVVTDEGGASCHALHARELGIPCITGTQHATKRIEDGAEIEVRADHGTIKIVS